MEKSIKNIKKNNFFVFFWQLYCDFFYVYKSLLQIINNRIDIKLFKIIGLSAVYIII
jgi:hypothetical protein